MLTDPEALEWQCSTEAELAPFVVMFYRSLSPLWAPGSRGGQKDLLGFLDRVQMSSQAETSLLHTRMSRVS